MTERTSAPFGSWPSPISAASLAQADIAMSDLRVIGAACTGAKVGRRSAGDRC